MKKPILKGTLGALVLLASAAGAPVLAVGPGGIAGTYDVEMKIGETTYHDLLVIDEQDQNPANGFNGSFTVPGVFTSRLTEAVATTEWAFIDLTFKIKAVEATTYDVTFSGYALKNRPFDEFSGSAQLADGSPLGEFTARKLTRKAECGPAPHS